MNKKISLVLVAVSLSLIAGGCVKQEAQQQNGNTETVVSGEDQSKNSYYKVEGVEGKTALESLQAKHKVETKEFPGLGQFVQTIEGVTPDSSHYWAFYINGKPSNVGASQYVAKSGDTLEFKLEAIQE